MAALTPEVIATVKATAPVLEVHGVTITTTFYGILFEEHPEAKQFFNMRHQVKDAEGNLGAQPRALADAVLAYANNIDNLGALTGAVTRIAHKHASLGVLPEHYPVVGGCLLKAISTVLGEAATPEIIDAWGKAYGVLADVFIGAENALRAENEAKPHGWSGFKPFVVDEKIRESADVYSFYIKPVDGSPLPPYLPGQYTSFRLKPDGKEIVHRNYSLSDTPGLNRWRVSIKRDKQDEAHPGVVSNYFHDIVEKGTILEVGPAYGEFIPEKESNENHRPVVFLSGGIGQTPLVSMLKTLLREEGDASERQFYFIHADKNSGSHALKSELADLAKKYPNLHNTYVYSQPSDTETLGKDYDFEGRIDVKVLRQAIPRPTKCTFYFCGPADFMVSMRGLLRWLGVPAEHVYYECFGPMNAEIEKAGTLDTR